MSRVQQMRALACVSLFLLVVAIAIGVANVPGG